MEKKVEHNSRKNGKDEVFTTIVDDMSEKEIRLFAEFIHREDIIESQDLIILERTENFEEAEVIVFFKDELFIRCRKKEETVFHNELLAINSDFKFEWDSATSLRKDDISCISVLRPTLCECQSCSEKRQKGDIPEQPKYYVLEIMTAAKDCSIRIPDKDSAFALQDYIRQWRFGTGEFAVKVKRKNRKSKNKKQ